jgi:low affinity Fe/Cu permease
MNTISSVVTFLMVFLVQNPPNRVSAALQMKLDELIRVTAARERLARMNGCPNLNLRPCARKSRRMLNEKGQRKNRNTGHVRLS